jgi:penicillin G amidase
VVLVEPVDGHFKDDLPEEYWPGGGSRWYEVMRNLVSSQTANGGTTKKQKASSKLGMICSPALSKKQSHRCKKSTANDLGQMARLGRGPRRNLPQRHPGRIRYRPDRSPVQPRALRHRRRFEEIVNATGWTVGESFEVDWLPSMRMIVDMGNLRNSLTVHTTGRVRARLSPAL